MAAYRFTDPDGIYFVTFTVVEWVNVFARKAYINILLNSLRHCQKEKGLIIYAWCIMTNHLHLIISRQPDGEDLSDIVRDFKKYTSKQIIGAIQNHPKERRKNWMLWIFKTKGARNRRNREYQFWRNGSHAKCLETNHIMQQKLDYIHNNPVVAGIVDEAADYVYSSARSYIGRSGLLEVVMIE